MRSDNRQLNQWFPKPTVFENLIHTVGYVSVRPPPQKVEKDPDDLMDTEDSQLQHMFASKLPTDGGVLYFLAHDLSACPIFSALALGRPI